jgi:hypothetical protein
MPAASLWSLPNPLGDVFRRFVEVPARRRLLADDPENRDPFSGVSKTSIVNPILTRQTGNDNSSLAELVGDDLEGKGRGVDEFLE